MKQVLFSKPNQLNLKIELVVGLLSLLSAFSLSSCSKEVPEVFYMEGDREELNTKGIDTCYGDFKVIEEKTFGPFTRAKLKCIKSN